MQIGRKAIIAISPQCVITLDKEDRYYANVAIINLMKKFKNLTECQYIMFSCYSDAINNKIDDDLWKTCQFRFDAINKNLTSFDSIDIPCDKKVYADVYLEDNGPVKVKEILEMMIKVHAE